MQAQGGPPRWARWTLWLSGGAALLLLPALLTHFLLLPRVAPVPGAPYWPAAMVLVPALLLVPSTFLVARNASHVRAARRRGRNLGPLLVRGYLALAMIAFASHGVLAADLSASAAEDAVCAADPDACGGADPPGQRAFLVAVAAGANDALTLVAIILRDYAKSPPKGGRKLRAPVRVRTRMAMARPA